MDVGGDVQRRLLLTFRIDRRAKAEWVDRASMRAASARGSRARG
ncbi:MAG: hypothetical protein AVDCRST_MAG71-1157 [uncultured Lysobacter sp.]|uniref:Uncharacterized protein n=1 Tax=uncultured Lysobacter sp. TaxID=271060 RepID=A0A6J4KZ75_9GAMM|nr:MAG: hypothetical protein AVDCRST_MAG71-1157 [uncultured Lysobacter sp.]